MSNYYATNDNKETSILSLNVICDFNSASSSILLKDEMNVTDVNLSQVTPPDEMCFNDNYCQFENDKFITIADPICNTSDHGENDVVNGYEDDSNVNKEQSIHSSVRENISMDNMNETGKSQVPHIEIKNIDGSKVLYRKPNDSRIVLKGRNKLREVSYVDWGNVVVDPFYDGNHSSSQRKSYTKIYEMKRNYIRHKQSGG
jgi:hypothetical protein